MVDVKINDDGTVGVELKESDLIALNDDESIYITIPVKEIAKCSKKEHPLMEIHPPVKEFTAFIEFVFSNNMGKYEAEDKIKSGLKIFLEAHEKELNDLINGNKCRQGYSTKHNIRFKKVRW